MKPKKEFILLIISLVSVMFLGSGLNYAQEEYVMQTPAEPEIQWIWGEVVSVDPTTSQIVVKYFDYETDSDKEMSINVDNKTTYENVKTIDEIKPGDTVSIDYIVNTEGKNIGKNISVEKPESTPEIPEEGGDE